MANKHAKAKNLRARALVSLVAIIVVVAVCAYLGLCGFGKGTMINYLKPWGDAISLGLDLRGGVYTVYQAENNGDPDFDTKMESTVSILTSRLTRQGFTEATVTRQGSDRIRVEIPNVSDPNQILTIIGQIEGHYILPSQNKTTKYEHVIPQLVAIEESKEIEGLLIILNTVGGDVEAGLAIAELLSTMKTPTASLVLGGGHSIGVPLAVSCKKSFIVPSATMTVHPVRMNGLVLGVPQTLSYFEKMQDRIVNFVVNNSSIEKNSFKNLMMKTGELVMDVGTVLDGEDAVNCGLIDELGGLSDALDFLNKMIEEK